MGKVAPNQGTFDKLAIQADRPAPPDRPPAEGDMIEILIGVDCWVRAEVRHPPVHTPRYSNPLFTVRASDGRIYDLTWQDHGGLGIKELWLKRPWQFVQTASER
jgi:hypothetical protein